VNRSGLRTSLIVVCVVLTIVAFFALVTRSHAPLLFFGFEAILVLVFLAIERPRYSSTKTPTSTPWQQTDERFRDPVSGEPLAVYYNPATGERDYRPLA
jgi:hypothetical protein